MFLQTTDLLTTCYHRLKTDFNIRALISGDGGDAGVTDEMAAKLVTTV